MQNLSLKLKNILSSNLYFKSFLYIYTMPNKTIEQYNNAFDTCFQIFYNKSRDYGPSWKIFRPASLIDQIFIKAWRVRQIQETGIQKIADNIEEEFQAMVNYSIMGLLQIHEAIDFEKELSLEDAVELYTIERKAVTELMLQKNHDYGEAWRMLSQVSFVDLILTKLERMKQIIINDGKTLISEGLEGNFHDIINYALFALIKINEENKS